MERVENMTEKNKQLLNYIINGYSVELIKKEMNLTNKQFLRRLHLIMYEGYNLKRYFYIDGQSVYRIYREIDYSNNFIINSSKSENQFLMISDTHFGSNFEDFKLVEEIYNYAKKNDIHTIFHLGDFIDGIYTKTGKLLSTVNKEYQTLDKQIQHVVESYPFDSHILNYILLGNHDYYSLQFDGIDIATKLEHSRTDFIPIGYGNKTVSIRNINMNLIHYLGTKENRPLNTNYINFYGHSHRARIEMNQNYRKVMVPSLSKSILDPEESAFPGAIHVILKTSDKKTTFVIKQLILIPKLKVANTIIFREGVSEKVKIKGNK